MTPIEIDVQTVKSYLDENRDFLLLDCREQNEYDIARIEGSILIPMNEIPGRVDEIVGFKDKDLVVHCHLGGRSLRVTQWLRENGFEQAQNMTGGIDAWSDEIDDTVAKY